MDIFTIRDLELVQNVKTNENRASVLSCIDHTKTAGGARLLRSSLLQPLSLHDSIIARQSTVEVFLNDETLYLDLSKIFQSKLMDFDRILRGLSPSLLCTWSA